MFLFVFCICKNWFYSAKRTSWYSKDCFYFLTFLYLSGILTKHILSNASHHFLSNTNLSDTEKININISFDLKCQHDAFSIDQNIHFLTGILHFEFEIFCKNMQYHNFLVQKMMFNFSRYRLYFNLKQEHKSYLLMHIE